MDGADEGGFRVVPTHPHDRVLLRVPNTPRIRTVINNLAQESKIDIMQGDELHGGTLPTAPGRISIALGIVDSPAGNAEPPRRGVIAGDQK